jgi:catechol 2,3-dioxygenase-like lactoylglutathione lyase family enzyme
MSENTGSKGSAIMLNHVAVVSGNLEISLEFYRRLFELASDGIEPDPIRPGCRRSYLHNTAGNRIIELIEDPDIRHSAIAGKGSAHHIGFLADKARWSEIESRAKAGGHDVRNTGSILFLRDPDGVVIEVEQMPD